MLNSRIDECRILGFVGCDSYDIIHYLSRILLELGESILLIDYSSLQALSCGIVEDKEIVDFRGVDIAFDLELQEKLFHQYSYILLDFGIENNHKNLAECDEIYLVTDYQLYKIQLVLNTVMDEEQQRFLILRNDVGIKVKEDAILIEFDGLVDKENTYKLNSDEKDLKNCILCQHNGAIAFKRISGDMKELLVKILEIDYERKEILAAIKKAARG